jgi:hypothetical protein
MDDEPAPGATARVRAAGDLTTVQQIVRTAARRLARCGGAAEEELTALETLAAAAGEAIQRIGLIGVIPAPAPPGEPDGPQAGPVDRVPPSLPAIEDHERIARDWHDAVLQQMFATGLRLQELQRTLAGAAAAQAIDDALAQIDDSIRELRGVIFGQEYGHQQPGGPGLITFRRPEVARSACGEGQPPGGRGGGSARSCR